MNKVNTFGLLAILLLFTATTIQAQTVRYADLETRDGLYYKKGESQPFTGMVEDPGEQNGKIEAGKRVGRWTGYHSNGEKEWITDYEEGIPTNQIMWYSNGNKYQEMKRQNGRPHGLYQRWYKSGQVAEETTFNEGQREGVSRIYDMDGHLFKEVTYQNNQKQGPEIWYFNNGQKRWETYFEADEKTGTWTQWNREGGVMNKTSWDG